MPTMSQTFCIGYFALSLPHFCEEDIISNFREDKRTPMVSDRAKMQI